MCVGACSLGVCYVLTVCPSPTITIARTSERAHDTNYTLRSRYVPVCLSYAPISWPLRRQVRPCRANPLSTAGLNCVRNPASTNALQQFLRLLQVGKKYFFRNPILFACGTQPYFFRNPTLWAAGEDPGLQSELGGEYTRPYGDCHEHAARFSLL